MLNALIIIIVTYTGFIAAYHYYGKPLGQGIGTGGNQLAQFYAGIDVIWQF